MTPTSSSMLLTALVPQGIRGTFGIRNATALVMNFYSVGQNWVQIEFSRNYMKHQWRNSTKKCGRFEHRTTHTPLPLSNWTHSKGAEASLPIIERFKASVHLSEFQLCSLDLYSSCNQWTLTFSLTLNCLNLHSKLDCWVTKVCALWLYYYLMQSTKVKFIVQKSSTYYRSLFKTELANLIRMKLHHLARQVG